MNTKIPTHCWRRLAVLFAALSIPMMAAAQNCVLCYTQAGGSGPRMIQALRSGIVILVIPPMMICIGITWMAYNTLFPNQSKEELRHGQRPQTTAASRGAHLQLRLFVSLRLLQALFRQRSGGRSPRQAEYRTPCSWRLPATARSPFC